MGDAADDAERRADEERWAPPDDAGFEFVEGVGYEHPSASGSAPEGEAMREAPPVTPRMPTTWTEVRERLAHVLGGQAEADEWIAQAIESRYGVRDEWQLDRSRRAMALQRLIGTLYSLEEIDDGGLLPFRPDVRHAVRMVFAKNWTGAVLNGPEWRLSPDETDRPTRAQVEASTEFAPE